MRWPALSSRWRSAEIFGVGEVSPGRVFEGLHQAVSLRGNEPITGAAVDFTHNVADDAAHRDPTKWRSGYRTTHVKPESIRHEGVPAGNGL